MHKETIDLAFSFDTTGSMYPCLTQVRQNVEGTVKFLFKEIPNIRIAIITHGDYCDGKNVINMLDFSSNEKTICDFINKAPKTDGGDTAECYEFVLNQARTLSWTSGKNKALVMIADANPHPVGYHYYGGGIDIKNNLDWKNEAGLLVEAGINIYPIQALGYKNNNTFYTELAKISKTIKLDLEQFSEIRDILIAISMQRGGRITEFETVLQKRGDVSYNVWKTIDILSGRAARPRTESHYTVDLGLTPIGRSRFQILNVYEDCDIAGFVRKNGLIFKIGRGFYEFTKRVTVQDYKEVIVKDNKTGDMFTGEEARKILGIPVGVTANVSPRPSEYTGFIQSTSANRKLLRGTKFLYEVDSTR